MLVYRCWNNPTEITETQDFLLLLNDWKSLPIQWCQKEIKYNTVMQSKIK